MSENGARGAGAGPRDTDLIVVGGGPAGCAAALMAASLGMRTVLIEPDRLCGKLYAVGALDNVPGGHRSGPGLADAIAADVRRAAGCEVLLGSRAERVAADDRRVAVTLDSGRVLTAPRAVVATGTGPLPPAATDWVSVPPDLRLPSLWETRLPELAGRSVIVLGADRPLGTVLRSHPSADVRLHVLHPAADDYKSNEVLGDPRAVLHRVGRVTINRGAGGMFHIWARHGHSSGEREPDGEGTQPYTAEAVYLNLGTAPVVPDGDLTRGADGYCPPGDQHPRVRTAGDLRGARFQRIVTAQGSGAEAVLAHYYEAVRPSE
ncbi:FAD-dependent oxidoreductase [Streptomyces sp. URMC 123]|uniref:FAD-dependent oxidoreductase n=1 Tax=Streptomyces sp. URMC 123 TaxID=3423403 RepID=UPI003F1C1E97